MKLRHHDQRAATKPGGLRGATRAGQRIRTAIESGVLTGLLLVVMASTITGAFEVLLCAVALAWLALAVIVGPRNVLDAGCAFMLVVVGVVLVADLATSGPVSVLP